jgi:fibronectin type 3 domain-containing protein
MRIIGHIEHPQLKISIFKMENRISVKFENARYEQTFKLGDDERFAKIEAIQDFVDAAFITSVLEQFQAMHRNKMEAMTRCFPASGECVFEEII